MHVTYETMNERMIEVVPALRKRYKQYEKEWFAVDDDGDPVGPHVAYGDFFTLHLRNLLRTSNDDVEITRLLAFIEGLAHHPDDNVVNVVRVTVVEGLLDTSDSNVLRRTIRLVGPTTRSIADDSAEMFHHCNEIRGLIDEYER
jgi:hypothetical protein